METGIEQQVPGGVYLCQVNENMSCGACCGLYNIWDLSKNTLEAMLMARTRKFAKTPRNAKSILDFKKWVVTHESQKRPYPKFHHCPYIGLIGENLSRVGCLLHPLGEKNDGVDFRGLSFYGGMACRVYFCPTYRHLTTVWKIILKRIITDWYLYGLVITERLFLRALFQEIEMRLNRPLACEDFTGNAQAVAALREFLSLKQNWPFRSPNISPCHYFFEDGLYKRIPLNYKGMGTSRSRFDIFLISLGTGLSDRALLNRAEKLIEKHIDNIIKHIN